MRRLILGLFMGVLAGALCTSAYAQPMLMIDDGVSGAITVPDEGAGDTHPGMIGATGLQTGVAPVPSPYGGWSTIVLTGLTDPQLPAPLPHMDLNAVANSSKAANLTMIFTDTDFSATPFAHSAIGGTLGTGATGTFDLYVDPANVPFAQANLIASLAFGAGAFHGDIIGAVPPPGPGGFSVTMVATLNHTQAAVSSFNWEERVPEPATLLLLGVGLLGFAGFHRRKKV